MCERHYWNTHISKYYETNNCLTTLNLYGEGITDHGLYVMATWCCVIIMSSILPSLVGMVYGTNVSTIHVILRCTM